MGAQYVIADSMQNAIRDSSWIRKMFEAGALLKQREGEENVFDFSLGKPDLKPPDSFQHALLAAAEHVPPGAHSYMANAGFGETREAVAITASQEQGIEIPASHIIMTCGAAGGLNCILKTLLNPGDEVIIPAPYFPEYNFYVTNHHGNVWRVATKPDFSLDLEAIDAAINSKTKVVLINSPNNPTGQVYDQDSIEALATLLALRSSELGQPIFLVSDEPYRKVVFDGVTVPSIMALYPNSFVANSYSKSLSLSGERLGYIAVNPRIVQPEFILDGLFIANRILGFINAPALMQRVIAEVPDACVDINKYQARRDFMSLRLGTIGYEIPEPGGTFYMFPKSPIGDDVHFVRMLLQENILAVPSTGFGIPGYFRLALCLDQKTMKRSLAGFIRAWKACRG